MQMFKVIISYGYSNFLFRAKDSLAFEMGEWGSLLSLVPIFHFVFCYIPQRSIFLMHMQYWYEILQGIKIIMLPLLQIIMK